jgi:hypothetical protein
MAEGLLEKQYRLLEELGEVYNKKTCPAASICEIPADKDGYCQVGPGSLVQRLLMIPPGNIGETGMEEALKLVDKEYLPFLLGEVSNFYRCIINRMRVRESN